MRPITEKQCLRAAERALQEHRETHPATTDECHAIALAHRERAAAMRLEAERLWTEQPPHWGDPRWRLGANGILIMDARHEAHRLNAEADKLDACAASWDAIAADPIKTWREYEDSLVARVDYYQRLIARRAVELAGQRAALERVGVTPPDERN